MKHTNKEAIKVIAKELSNISKKIKDKEITFKRALCSPDLKYEIEHKMVFNGSYDDCKRNWKKLWNQYNANSN